jgi:hypothetical protein
MNIILFNPDENFVRRIQAVYLGMIGFSDSLLGRILQTLERTGLDRDTAVVALLGPWRLGRRFRPGREMAQRPRRLPDPSPPDHPHPR